MSNNKINVLLIGLVLSLMINAIPLTAQEENNSVSGKKRLPSVAPIDPTNRVEEDVVIAPDLYNRDSEVFQYFRNSLDEKVISTSERNRQIQLKKLQERAKISPMNRPAADGSKFIDIYAPAQIRNDGKAFHDLNDPDDRYAEAESGPLAKAVEQLDTAVFIIELLSGISNNQNGMPNSGPSSGMMKSSSGMYGTTNQPEVKPEKNKKNDTNLIFEASEGTNPFAAAKVPDINADISFDFFKADRDFKEKPTTLNSAMGSGMPSYGMGSGMPGSEMGPPKGYEVEPK